MAHWDELAEVLLQEAGYSEQPAPELAEAASGSDACMNDLDWENLAQEILGDGEAATAGAASSSSGGHEELPDAECRQQVRRSNRSGAFGSSLLREALARAIDGMDVASQQPIHPPGSIEAAREAKAAKRRKLAASSSPLADGPKHLLLPGIGGHCWAVMKQLECSATQQALVATAACAAASGHVKTSDSDLCVSRLLQPRQHVTTFSQFAEDCNVARSTLTSLVRMVAAAAVEASRCLWACLMERCAEKMVSGQWRGILLCHRCRYDESPTLTRLRGKSISDSSQHGKVVQAEASLHLVFADGEGRLFEIRGVVPSALSVVDSTTAECLKRVRSSLVGLSEELPWLRDLSKHFRWVLQQATVDRYAANFKAEASLLHDSLDPNEMAAASPTNAERPERMLSKLTLPCDVHKIHQAHKSAFDLASHDISGMLSTALSQHGTGTLVRLREILATVFEHRLVIYHAPPPPAEHREAIYELLLASEALWCGSHVGIWWL